MTKTISPKSQQTPQNSSHSWLDLDGLADAKHVWQRTKARRRYLWMPRHIETPANLLALPSE
jgi:hypothetical protein